jgi:cytosine/adenosine deaminase-related metal-dependent hydrolase
MLTITDATAIMVDEVTETTGDLVVDGDGTLDASHCVVTPGLVNAHHHLLQSAFRTLPGTRGVAMRDWLPTMAAAYTRAGVDPELASVAAAVGIAEGLLNGVTTVADHHLTWPSGSDTVSIARATADAARALGGRLVFVRGSARDDPQEAALSAEAIVRALLPELPTSAPVSRREGAEAGNSNEGGVTSDGMLQLAVGPAGVHSDSRETFELLGEVAAKHGLRRRTQSNEQVDTEIALSTYGKRPIDLLEEWGWLGPDVTLAHLCDVTPDEIARLARAGITATHAPGCDLPMGWGIAPVAALLAAGIRVGLGTSGGGSNDAGHLLADARLAMQVAPLVGRPLAAREVLGLATAGSAVGLGRPELGHLREGAAADLCVWDISGVADAGVADPIAGLLWANPGRRPKHVVVNGQVVVRDYALVNAEETELVARLRERLRTT